MDHPHQHNHGWSGNREEAEPTHADGDLRKQKQSDKGD
jgi:hypothetical protein